MRHCGNFATVRKLKFCQIMSQNESYIPFVPSLLTNAFLYMKVKFIYILATISLDCTGDCHGECTHIRHGDYLLTVASKKTGP